MRRRHPLLALCLAAAIFSIAMFLGGLYESSEHWNHIQTLGAGLASLVGIIIAICAFALALAAL
tara:strand:- start:1106 stop:1297 length:192 start_codon:yes stop_codon:yes gene_type:complete